MPLMMSLAKCYCLLCGCSHKQSIPQALEQVLNKGHCHMHVTLVTASSAGTVFKLPTGSAEYMLLQQVVC